MEIYALVGASGTGKSYCALYVAKTYNIEYIIDDGILICNNKIIEGKSAKLEKTMVGAVKCAVFMHEEQRLKMIETIKKCDIKSVLILGTSEKMVNKIASLLELGKIKKIIRIEDVATEEEIEIARQTRNMRGMHTIPVSTFAIKKDFSGILVDKLKILLKAEKGKPSCEETKSVVRPTFSYFGEFHIREKVICDIAEYAAKKEENVFEVLRVHTQEKENGIEINVSVCLKYGCDIVDASNKIAKYVVEDVEYMTSLNIEKINVLVRDLSL